MDLPIIHHKSLLRLDFALDLRRAEAPLRAGAGAFKGMRGAEKGLAAEELDADRHHPLTLKRVLIKRVIEKKVF